jgi:transcriptional regulator with GAF, ATPase, and Fis domain
LSDAAPAVAEEAEKREDENDDQNDPENSQATSDSLAGASGSEKTAGRRSRIRPHREYPQAGGGGILVPAVTETSNQRLFDLLAGTARELAGCLRAEASAVSRVIGDVLILVAECAPEGRTLQMGQGYLVPDYPATQAVLRSGTPLALTLDDEDVDEAEARVLEELGFASLLMLRLEIGGATWGLVEVYRAERLGFDEADVRAAEEILARTSARAG